MKNGSMAVCIFCEIAEQKLSSFIVYEDKQFIAFLDKRPLFPGHCLLVPKKHVETFTDLPQNMTGPFFQLAQRLDKAVEQAMQAQGSFVAMNNRVSQSVPHLHLHVVPRNKQDGLKGFFWPRHPYQNEAEMLAVQLKIKQFIESE